MDVPNVVRSLAESVRNAGGRALLAGGAVRDRLLGLTPNDFDIEIYGLAPEKVLALAEGMGTIHDVGKAFGILELRLKDGTIHLSLPRRESKVAPGHRGFIVGADPRMTPEDAARRRDFTINAIAEDPLTGEVLDPFRGKGDLERKVLRVVDAEHFGEDPLRVLRGAVFAAQFELAVDPATDEIIRRTISSLGELPKERIGDEWQKLLLRPWKPSRGLALLMEWGVFPVLHPDFVQLPKTRQNPKWHPEGDVWTHTLLAVDEAAELTRSASLRESGGDPPSPRHWRGFGRAGEAISSGGRSGQAPQSPGRGDQGVASPLGELGDRNDDERWWVMLATLCHDLGKAKTTERLRGAWRSPGHDVAGVEPTRRFLKSITANRRTTEVVVRLVRQHLQPLLQFNAEARGRPVSDGAVRALARRLYPSNIFLLTLVADADHCGRGPFHGEHGQTIPAPAHDAGERLRGRAAALGVLRGLPQPVLRGSDLIALGLPPGPMFDNILHRAEELADVGTSRDDLLACLRGVTSVDETLARLG